MNFTLHIWRQKNTQSDGSFVTYEISDIDSDTSFLEMLDQLNEELIEKGEDCVVFDYDCREGICGTCSLVINGHPHGEKKATTTCQLYMRDYANQRELWIEPWRAKSFPIVKGSCSQAGSIRPNYSIWWIYFCVSWLCSRGQLTISQ